MLYAGSGSPIPNDTMEQFKASEEDWQRIEAKAIHYSIPGTIWELHGRVAALEAEQAKESGKCPKTLEAFKQIGEYVKPRPPLYADPYNPLVSYSVGEVRPTEEWFKWHFPDKEHFSATAAAHRALYDHGYERGQNDGYAQGLAAGRAEQQAMAKLPTDSDYDAPQSLHSVALDMVDSLGRSFNLLPEILDTLRRAIREPMAEREATCKPALQVADDLTPEPESAAQSDPQVLFSVTLAGSNAIRWEDVINALTIAEAKLFDLWEYSKGIDPWCLQVADTAYPAYRAVHDLMNECRRTGATGAIGGLASPPPIASEPKPEPVHSQYFSGHGYIVGEINRALAEGGWTLTPEPKPEPIWGWRNVDFVGSPPSPYPTWWEWASSSLGRRVIQDVRIEAVMPRLDQPGATEPAVEPEPSPSPAGDAGLVKEVLDAMGEGIEADVEARAAILAVAKWLRKKCCPTAASLLEREANQ
jgi:hypothetical protein